MQILAVCIFTSASWLVLLYCEQCTSFRTADSSFTWSFFCTNFSTINEGGFGDCHNSDCLVQQFFELFCDICIFSHREPWLCKVWNEHLIGPSLINHFSLMSKNSYYLGLTDFTCLIVTEWKLQQLILTFCYQMESAPLVL